MEASIENLGPQTEDILPPEERAVMEEGMKTAEEILRRQERQRRARLTFALVVIVGALALIPVVALYIALCVRLFEWAA